MMNRPFGIVYCATNIKNGRKYIGVTTRQLKMRKSSHLSDKNSPLIEDIHKYGKDCFIWDTLKECSSYEELKIEEVNFINQHDATNPVNGYNRRKNGMVPKISTEYTRLMIRIPNWMIVEVDQMAMAQNRNRSNLIETLLRERFGKKNEKSR